MIKTITKGKSKTHGGKSETTPHRRTMQYTNTKRSVRSHSVYGVKKKAGTRRVSRR